MKLHKFGAIALLALRMAGFENLRILHGGSLSGRRVAGSRLTRGPQRSTNRLCVLLALLELGRHTSTGEGCCAR